MRSLVSLRARLAVAEAVRGSGPSQGPFELSIRINDQHVSCRDFGTYLAFLDGIYGRTDQEGYQVYAHRTFKKLEVSQTRSGSLDLNFLFDLLNVDQVWRVVVLYLIARTAPAIVRGEAAKNWAEAVKTGVETYKLLSHRDERPSPPGFERTGAAESQSRPLVLSRPQRMALRAFIRDDPRLAGLTNQQIGQLVRVVEQLLSHERHRLPGAVRFTDNHVIEISLRIRSE